MKYILMRQKRINMLLAQTFAMFRGEDEGFLRLKSSGRNQTLDFMLHHFVQRNNR
jgi:hypothetical protein